MGKLRKLTAKLLSVTLAAVMSLCAGITASAKPAYQWGVDFSAENPEDCYGWKGNGSTKFYTDNTVHTPGSAYSILLETTDYDTACVEKTYDVEPNTKYKFSAMVKYSGYQRFPYDQEESGACIGEAYYYNPHNNIYMVPYGKSDFTVSPDWTRLEYVFTTGDETTHGLRLQNGNCIGKAWFSDIRLEKEEKTNSWNILAVFFRNVDANVVLNGEQIHFKNSLTETNIYEMNKYCLDTLPANLRALSDGKMTVNSIDRYYSDEVLTEKDLSLRIDNEYNTQGYQVDQRFSPVIRKVLDKYLAQKEYQQIIIFVPFFKDGVTRLSGNWLGLGGSNYKEIHFAQITNTWDESFANDVFQGYVAVHEVCHGLEYASIAIDPVNTPNFHSTIYDYPDPNISVYETIHMFMTATLPGGKGLNPSVFNIAPTGNYALVSNDMTTGKGIMPISSATTPPAPKNLRAEPYVYKKISVRWDSVPNASGYQFANFKNGNFNEIRETLDCKPNPTAVSAPISDGVQYYYGVRTVYTVNGTNYYSDWTTLTYPNMGGNVVRGDVDNNGVFNINDLAAAISYFFSGEKIDKRTADAVGIVGRDNINVRDIENIVDWILS